MTWTDAFPPDRAPDLEQMGDFVNSPHWTALCTFIADTYSIAPRFSYSKCTAAPGWNVKYQKGGRALCTLYPAQNQFTCLVSIGSKEAAEAEFILPSCTPYVQKLYQNIKPLNGARWLMIEVTNSEILQDVQKLLCVRMPPS